MADLEILGICGSLRAKSYNLQGLKAAGELMPPGMKLRIVSIADVPMYNLDVQEKGWPEAVERLKADVAKADGVLFASPEYNYSISGVLKNSIDWLSRYKDQPFKWKPCASFSVTGGPLGGARSFAELRKVLLGLTAMMMPPPDAFIGPGQQKFDANGAITDEATKKFLTDHMKNFETWIGQVKKLSS
jgi:chromate reductase